MNFEPPQENTSLLNIVAAWNKAMLCDVSQWKIVAFAGQIRNPMHEACEIFMNVPRTMAT